MNIKRFDAFRGCVRWEQARNRREIERLEKRNRALSETDRLITDIDRCWFVGKPDKHGRYKFLVRDFALDVQVGPGGATNMQLAWCDHFHAKEFIHHGGKNISLPIAPISEVKTLPVCNVCHKEGDQTMIVGEYWYYENEAWCEWQIALYALCTSEDCGAVTRLTNRISAKPMFHLLSKPIDENQVT